MPFDGIFFVGFHVAAAVAHQVIFILLQNCSAAVFPWWSHVPGFLLGVFVGGKVDFFNKTMRIIRSFPFWVLRKVIGLIFTVDAAVSGVPVLRAWVFMMVTLPMAQFLLITLVIRVQIKLAVALVIIFPHKAEIF